MDIPNQLPGTIEALGFPDLVRACHLPQTYAMPDAGHSPDFRRNLNTAQIRRYLLRSKSRSSLLPTSLFKVNRQSCPVKMVGDLDAGHSAEKPDSQGSIQTILWVETRVSTWRTVSSADRSFCDVS